MKAGEKQSHEHQQEQEKCSLLFQPQLGQDCDPVISTPGFLSHKKKNAIPSTSTHSAWAIDRKKENGKNRTPTIIYHLHVITNWELFATTSVQLNNILLTHSHNIRNNDLVIPHALHDIRVYAAKSNKLHTRQVPYKCQPITRYILIFCAIYQVIIFHIIFITKTTAEEWLPHRLSPGQWFFMAVRYVDIV